ncbi:MAG: flagellar biosynthesis regulator FlaF [Pseudomonadota bacterium]
MSHDAYQQAARRAQGPRETEYRAFCEATSRLLKAKDAARDDLRTRIDAIHFNRSLWGALAADCRNNDNALPQETRAAIVNLSDWVSRHSSSVMRAGADVEPLIEINKMMIDGLSGKSPEAA